MSTCCIVRICTVHVVEIGVGVAYLTCAVSRCAGAFFFAQRRRSGLGMWCDILRNSEIELHAEGFNTLL